MARNSHIFGAFRALISPRGRFVVTLASVGNPDFGQDSSRSVPGVPRTRVRVASLRHASEACRLYITHYDLGGGNWSGGDVTDVATDAPVARISYNGRAWAPGKFPQPEISLADPDDPDRGVAL